MAATQRERYVQQLKVFRDRLLNIDMRNPSLFLRRIVRKRSFDIAALDDPAIAARCTEAVLKRDGGEVLLVPDRDLSDEAEQARKDLTRLARFAAARTDETGLRELYFGLCWLEGHLDKDVYTRGPLALVSVELRLKRGGREPGWYLGVPEGAEPEPNAALLAALHKYKGWRAPDDAEEHVAKVFEAAASAEGNGVCALLAGLAAWFMSIHLPAFQTAATRPCRIQSIARKDLDAMARQPLQFAPYAVAGLFPQASTALYMDLEEMIRRVEEENETNQGIVDNLLETPFDNVDDNEAQVAAIDLNAVPADELNVVLPSDPSQSAVVAKAHKADCVVVRGPPGTGKSQVIVNLIADALSRGERVVVVCQKRAALDVVYDRLQGIGLGDAAYLVHDAGGDRAALYKKMGSVLGQTGQPGDPPAGKLAELGREIDGLIARLRTLVDPLNEDRHGERLYNLYLEARTGFRPAVELPASLTGMQSGEMRPWLNRVRTLQPGMRKYDLDPYPLALRAFWDALGHLDRVRWADAFKNLAEKARKSDPCHHVADAHIRTNLLESAPAYADLHRKWYRIFLPRWYRARNWVDAHRDTMGTLEVAQWRAAILNAQALVEALGEFKPVMREAWHAKMIELLGQVDRIARLADHAAGATEADFENLQQHDQVRREIAEEHIKLLAACANQLPEEADWAEHVWQEAVLRWIDEAEKQHTALRGQPFDEYEKLRLELDRKLARKQEIAAREVLAAWRQRALNPLFSDGEAKEGNRKADTLWNKLAYEVGKKRYIKPLRVLLREFAWPLSRLAPCWLASPEVVSEVFPLERGLFDLVIFDEASQLSVERSLPVLYRGKRVVIAGDEQQMPPSRFFEASVDEEEMDQDDDWSDLEARHVESLLMLAKRIYGFDYLAWHYRSRFQELIDYSNHAFYDGQLHIAANLNRGEADAPIRWVQVDGVWEDRHNAVEARKVVDLMHEELAASAGAGFRSIGVITFNERQQEAIENEIEQRRRDDEGFADLMARAENPSSGKIDDKPFVKNIENVQGDERDLIIFSVGYARDREGNLYKRFGPLSNEGGENRLNVAVTRAKRGVIVVCSFDPNDLDVSTSKNLGPRRFKQYLQYARAVSERLDAERANVVAELNPTAERAAAASERFDGVRLAARLREALEARGYQVEPHWGVGEHRVDLAVVDPVRPERFCLGIECDGPTFHAARSVLERDVSRQKFLEVRGWKLVRVWTRNWWRDPEKELNRVLSLLPEPKKA